MSEQTAVTDKVARLKEHLASYQSLAIAFSAGVDSTFLLDVAFEVLGEKVCAITAQSATFPERELREAQAFCQQRGIRQIVFPTNEFSIPRFSQNPEDRCYICKQNLFSHIVALAHEHGLGPVADGSNTDDLHDYRPGHKALAELEIASPLLACAFSKQDIRDASRARNLPTWNKQSFSCLATRFPYGDSISPERLAMVDVAEQALLSHGLSTVRVRVNGNEARIEVAPDEFDVVLRNSAAIVAALKEAGFAYVSLDLQGYRTGAMNETLA